MNIGSSDLPIVLLMQAGISGMHQNAFILVKGYSTPAIHAQDKFENSGCYQVVIGK